MVYAGKSIGIYIYSTKEYAIGDLVEETKDYIKITSPFPPGIKKFYRKDIQILENRAQPVPDEPHKIWIWKIFKGKNYTFTLYPKVDASGRVSGEIASGLVVDENNVYIKLKTGDDIKTYYRKDIQYAQEIPGFTLTQDQQKALNKFVDVVGDEFNKSVEAAQKNCADFVERIKRCEPYECDYPTPGGQSIHQEIVGFENNKCHYLQEVSGVMKMDCKFSSATVDAIVRYNTLLAEANKQGENYSKSIINGRTEENPYQAALKNGECASSVNH